MTFINIDPDKILDDARNMANDVSTKKISKEDLKDKYSYLHTNSIHLFDISHELSLGGSCATNE